MVKKVVTVMNYPDRTNENIMCITWMKKTREHFPNDFKIEILYEKNISNLIKKYAKKFNITLKKADRSHEIDFTGHPDCIKASHNVNFKLYNLCKLILLIFFIIFPKQQNLFGFFIDIENSKERFF